MSMPMAARGRGNAAQLASQLNVSAAKEAARQVRLRGLGGIIAIDFVHMRGQPDRKAVEQAMRGAFKRDRAKVDVAPLSQFCVGELARQRRGRALSEFLRDDTGALSVETCALKALRRLQAEALSDRGRRQVLEVGPEVFAWLDADSIGWKARAHRPDRAALRTAREHRSRPRPGTRRPRLRPKRGNPNDEMPDLPSAGPSRLQTFLLETLRRSRPGKVDE